jgi:hypothetical protein
MNRYIIQQEASGWFWRLENDGWWWRPFYNFGIQTIGIQTIGLRTSAGPFATAEEAEQDARNEQFRRFSRGQPL